MNLNEPKRTKEIEEHNDDRQIIVGGRDDMQKSVDEDGFRESTVESRWDEVIFMYQTEKTAREIEITRSRGTALHVAVNDGRKDVVKVLVDAIIKHEKAGQDKDRVKALEMKDERGNTPLHLAASRGLRDICKCIIGKDGERKYLVKMENDQGETPLFLAALSWQKLAFAYLYHLFEEKKEEIDLPQLIRDDGDSILHCAIRREFFDLAIIIIRCYPQLIDIQNKEGFSPLKVLATRPSAFRSGSKLSWWNQILYYSTIVEETLDIGNAIKRYLEEKDEDESEKPVHNGNHQQNYSFFGALRHLAIKLVSFGVKQQNSVNDQHQAEEKDQYQHRISISDYHVPPNYATCQQFVKCGCISIMRWIKTIEKIKQKHKWGDQLLNAFMEKPYQSYLGSGGQPIDEDEEDTDPYSAFLEEEQKKHNEAGSTTLDQEEDETKEPTVKVDRKETAFLTAARYGIVEMVKVLQETIPSALHDTTTDKKNVLLVAVRNRQPLVVEALRGRKKVWKSLLLGVDKKENTVLHLAAKAPKRDRAWKVAGSAIQMMWDVKWFEYIKDLAPDHFSFRTNNDDQTAREIFKESHKVLISNSSEWLKDTSESCSVVAALIAGVSFATASTVPGGNNSDTGKPTLEGQPAFDAFALTSLVGLCFSVTALVMFLSILTSRKQANDFRKALPWKLLLGLSSLFVSIVAMFASFCAGHFFVIKDKYKQIMFPLYAATCLPVTFYAVVQFPLYIDLLITIFTKVPQSSDKGDD